MKNKFFLSFLVVCFGINTNAQDPDFFPDFTPYSPDPVINYGDGFFGAAWNDPCVLKEGDEYIMYVSAVAGGITLEFDSVAIYRMTSPDGYDWTLSSEEPVLDVEPGTYYEGGVETASVVFYNDEYHMYNTVYSENNALDFKISHATSSDGLNWEMDPTPFLVPNPASDWATYIVAEPGAVVKDDTLHVFFTASGLTGIMTIGMAKTVDGATILDTMSVVDMPTSVYPLAEEYRGLSTPSPCMVGDTLYLFTDVAQTEADTWTQVALHQFKSSGNLTEWYADTEPIHTKSDFTWTDGNYISEILAITPLMDGNKLRIWYSGHQVGHIDPETGDTTYNASFIGDELHVDPDFWGIGTSEYEFAGIVGTNAEQLDENEIQLFFNGRNGSVQCLTNENATLRVYNTMGQVVFSQAFVNEMDFELNYSGIVFIQVATSSLNKSLKTYSSGIE